MKIIFLNTWNGKVTDPITQYLRATAPSTDIFCFQEVGDNMKALCEQVLSGYELFSSYKLIPKVEDFSQAIYIRKNLTVVSYGSILQDEANVGLDMYVEVQDHSRSVFICNLHGAANPGDKLDNQSRLTQSEKLLQFFESHQPAIIGGDFNLLPETKSVGLFQEHGYRDLIREFKIQTTRNEYAWAMHPNAKQYYADYAFMSPTIKIESFTVPNNKVSDHLPLELVINV